MGPQGDPSSSLCIQVTDLVTAELHCGPVLCSKGTGKPDVNKHLLWHALGGMESRKGAAEGNQQWFGSFLLPVWYQSSSGGLGFGNGLLKGQKRRQEGAVL